MYYGRCANGECPARDAIGGGLGGGGGVVTMPLLAFSSGRAKTILKRYTLIRADATES